MDFTFSLIICACITFTDLLFYAYYLIFRVYRLMNGGRQSTDQEFYNRFAGFFLVLSFIFLLVLCITGSAVSDAFFLDTFMLGFILIMFFIATYIGEKNKKNGLVTGSVWYFGTSDTFLMMYSFPIFYFTVLCDCTVFADYYLDSNNDVDAGIYVFTVFFVSIILFIIFAYCSHFVFTRENYLAGRGTVADNSEEKFSGDESSEKFRSCSRGGSGAYADDSAGGNYGDNRRSGVGEYGYSDGAGSSGSDVNSGFMADSEEYGADLADNTGSSNPYGSGRDKAGYDGSESAPETDESAGYENAKISDPDDPGKVYASMYSREPYTSPQNLTSELRDAYSVLEVAVDAPSAVVHESYRNLVIRYRKELTLITRGNNILGRRKEIRSKKKLEIVQDAWKTVANARSISYVRIN